MSSSRVHPWVFLVLIIPFGVVFGYVSVTLAYELKQSGVSVGHVAALVAFSVLPHTWKFFWAPVIDVTLSQKKWYVLSGAITATGIAAMGFFPATQPGLAALSVVIFSTSLATTFLGMSVESLMANSTPEEVKGRVSGWFQAGNLGGAGIGGGLGLLLSQQLHSLRAASCIVGGLCLACCLALAFVPTPVRLLGRPGWIPGLRGTLAELWQMVRKRSGALALILCFLPIGSGAAPLSTIASEWSASADTVALITGLLGGTISAVGCLMGGWLCDRMDRKAAYVWFGIFQAASGVAMALLPRNQAMYVVWASVYTFSTGFTYAAFSAFVLEAIGKGAAATKYNALAALSNVPIYYMTNIDGWAHDRWSSRGMFFTESGLGVVGAVLFLVMANSFLGRTKPLPVENQSSELSPKPRRESP